MADPRHATTDELRQILIGAIAAAPTLAGQQPGVWISKVNEAIPFVASMMSEGSRQMQIAHEVATAEVFVAIYRSHEIEPGRDGRPSSTRLIVTFISERPNAEPETIRTHRTDTAAGKTMQARLDKLEPGQRIVLYKAFEEIKSGSHTGRKARTLVHFETAAPRSSDTATQAGRSGSPVPDPSPANPAPPPADTGGGASPTHDPDFGSAPDTPPPRGPGADDIDASLAKQFNDLPAKVKVNVARRLRESDITYPTPQQDRIDAFLAIIAAEERNA